VLELWVLVWVQLWLRSLLLLIGSAYGSGCHGGDYRGVEKEIFLWVWLQCGEYRAVCDKVFVDTRVRGLENQSLIFFGCRGIGSP